MLRSADARGSDHGQPGAALQRSAVPVFMSMRSTGPNRSNSRCTSRSLASYSKLPQNTCHWGAVCADARSAHGCSDAAASTTSTSPRPRTGQRCACDLVGATALLSTVVFITLQTRSSCKPARGRDLHETPCSSWPSHNSPTFGTHWPDIVVTHLCVPLRTGCAMLGGGRWGRAGPLARAGRTTPAVWYDVAGVLPVCC